MNPLLVSGAMALGGRLLDRIAPPPPAQPADGAAFSRELSRATAPTTLSPLRQTAAAYGVRDALDLENLAQNLGVDLQAHPHLQDFLSRTRLDESLTLEWNENGMYSLRTGGGRVFAFSEDSELGQMASLYKQMNSSARLARSAPGTSISQILSYVDKNPVAMGEISLRN